MASSGDEPHPSRWTGWAFSVFAGLWSVASLFLLKATVFAFSAKPIGVGDMAKFFAMAFVAARLAGWLARCWGRVEYGLIAGVATGALLSIYFVGPLLARSLVELGNWHSPSWMHIPAVFEPLVGAAAAGFVLMGGFIYLLPFCLTGTGAFLILLTLGRYLIRALK